MRTIPKKTNATTALNDSRLIRVLRKLYTANVRCRRTSARLKLVFVGLGLASSHGVNSKNVPAPGSFDY